MKTHDLRDAHELHQEYNGRIVGKQPLRDIPTSSRDLAHAGETDAETDTNKKEERGKRTSARTAVILTAISDSTTNFT